MRKLFLELRRCLENRGVGLQMSTRCLLDTQQDSRAQVVRKEKGVLNVEDSEERMKMGKAAATSRGLVEERRSKV